MFRNAYKNLPFNNGSGIIALSMKSLHVLQASDESLSKSHPWLENTFMGNVLVLTNDFAINSVKREIDSLLHTIHFVNVYVHK